MVASAILKIGLHTRYCSFQTQHVFPSLCINLHQHRVVIAHFIARTSISEMAAAAILNFGLHFQYYDFQTQYVFLSLCTNFHQNRMVIAHFIARTSISEMAAVTSSVVFLTLAGSHDTTCQISLESDEN
jgi:hypothetical protein